MTHTGRSPMLVLALMAAGTLSGLARADVVYVRDKVGGQNYNGSPNGVFLAGTGGTVKLTFSGGTPNRDQPLGAYDFELNEGNGWESLISYCIDPFQYLHIAGPNSNPGTKHTEVSLHGYMDITDEEEELIEILWANAFDDSLTDKKKAAAFQVILWEAAIDDDMNLSNGTFQVKNYSYSGQVLALANSWISNVLNDTWTERQELHVLSSPNTQDLLRPVPAPGALGLAAVGLAGVRWVRRRLA